MRYVYQSLPLLYPDVKIPRKLLTAFQGNFKQPDFQKVFYGSNYDALRKVKSKYDPHDIFYAKTAVGSAEWREREDGRLCKVDQWKTSWIAFDKA